MLNALNVDVNVNVKRHQKQFNTIAVSGYALLKDAYRKTAGDPLPLCLESDIATTLHSYILSYILTCVV